MNAQTAIEVLGRNTNLGYGIIIEGNTQEIEQALTMALHALECTKSSPEESTISDKADKVKNVIKRKFHRGNCGIFSSQNVVGDTMTLLYDEDGVEVYICYKQKYFEVFGLNSAEFSEVEKYYRSLSESSEI